MARFETSLLIPRPIDATFSFVTDFANAATWDPRVFEARKISEGAVGLNTRFEMLGGLLTKDTVERFHIPSFLRLVTRLEYEVVSFVPRREMVARGETEMLRYEDHLMFSAEGDGTRLHYVAMMELTGPLSYGDPLLQPIFEMIGAAATRGIPSAVEAATPIRSKRSSAPPIHQLPASPIVRPADVQRVVALDGNPILRNLLITQGYYDISRAISTCIGGNDMNWCTLATWASKTAGGFIRSEEVPARFRQLLEKSGHQPLINEARHVVTRGDKRSPDLVDIICDITYECAYYILTGNKVVYAELAQCCAEFLEELGGHSAPDSDELAAFQSRYRDGDPEPDDVRWGPYRKLVCKPQGGQRLLRAMVGCLYHAKFATDSKLRAELMLRANAYGGVHEQTRLQTYIVGGLNAPLTKMLSGWAHGHADRDLAGGERSALHAAIDATLPRLGGVLEKAWKEFSTHMLMTLPLPCGVLRLGHPLPQDPGARMFPAALEEIKDQELSDLLARYDALEVRVQKGSADNELADVGAIDWTDLDERMRFILTLFRVRQQDEHVFQPPFTEPQRRAIFDGSVPPGAL